MQLLRILIGSLHCLHLLWLVGVRAVFKWLSKVITWLRLLRLVMGLKESRQFFNQWEAKPKPVPPCTRDFSRALSELQVITRNCDWFVALSAPVVIGWSNCFGFGFSTVIWKPLYYFGIGFTTINWKSLYTEVKHTIPRLPSTSSLRPGKFQYPHILEMQEFNILNNYSAVTVARVI